MLKKVILTGATGGLGFQLASLLHEHGHEVVLVGSSLSKLINARSNIAAVSSRLHIVELDLISASDEELISLIVSSDSKLQGADTLINCAGLSGFDRIESQQLNSIEYITRLNLMVPIKLSALFVKHLKNSGRKGTIVNIGSMLGSIGFPFYATYSASKFGLRGFSEALRREISSEGFRIIYAAPGALNTSMNSELSREVLTDMIEPIDAAVEIFNALNSNKPEVFIRLKDKLIVLLNYIAPKLVSKSLESTVNKISSKLK